MGYIMRFVVFYSTAKDFKLIRWFTRQQQIHGAQTEPDFLGLGGYFDLEFALLENYAPPHSNKGRSNYARPLQRITYSTLEYFSPFTFPNPLDYPSCGYTLHSLMDLLILINK